MSSLTRPLSLGIDRFTIGAAHVLEPFLSFFVCVCWGGGGGGGGGGEDGRGVGWGGRGGGDGGDFGGCRVTA